MNILENFDRRARCGVLQGAIALALLMGAAEVSAACTAGGAPFLSGPVSVPHEGFRSGEVVTTASAASAVFRGCDRGSSANLTIEALLEYIGDVGGVPTFKTSSHSIGAQIQYRYLAVSGPGTEQWSSWINLGSTSQDFRAVNQYASSLPQTNLPMEFRAHFITLEDIGGGVSIGISDLDPAFGLTDNTYGEDLGDAVVASFGIRPREYASCWYTSAPPSALKLADATVSELRAEGSVGAAVDFSFSWRCKAGDDRPGGADFQFLSSKALDKTSGLLAVDGDAKGVDMLVKMKDKSGNYMPVPLGDHWWATHHFHRGTALPDIGRQEMQVQLRRNKEDIKPGNASSTMTVRLSLF
ncbi:fimbrial protein [Stenotrophomonas maltophilia]|uniref:fimbrial protein n=1 Tax=Stenotrophomonas maltophilia TaxID=40324 RepID=UPI00021E0B14|nr:hypothetical protein [Stenotrophomonas maltophilia]AEM51476.1 hypothetical protein BurJV3_2153 [Stenotrophomonas maltophilia JV3]